MWRGVGNADDRGEYYSRHFIFHLLSSAEKRHFFAVFSADARQILLFPPDKRVSRLTRDEAWAVFRFAFSGWRWYVMNDYVFQPGKAGVTT